ncbi:hypothetical protein Gasu2_13280 [Galdieria sulphuraria]|uniref:Uncharacterized protein n=1 Tax=Galdieria sulphuraria TaxID=130081 RepID=M2XG38_GALSU|nr:uncharacterized protein Gasu_35730 [Galdieria sulphuraria]EME29002.1 hypothetical protein Gasu_35730 [Galdieria sulphuraria]GJD06940.1 hypothetical protein Gasu2_13280 [Galdieria sulphuraria]|eukprot:XP_005705522.1 hypothetical protein Gasu_35730 [Galdieria sulphuraria]
MYAFVLSALLKSTTKHCKTCYCQSEVLFSKAFFGQKRRQGFPSSVIVRSSRANSQFTTLEQRPLPIIVNVKNPSELTQVTEEVEPPVVTLLDSKLDRSLSCYVEHEFDHEGTTFVVLSPCSQPVFFASYQRDQTGDWELTPLEDEEVIDRLFPSAFETLAEQEIFLNRSAVTLTIDGDLESLEKESEVEIEAEEDVRLVSTFMDGLTENEYYIFANMDPFLILGKKSGDNVILLGNGEFDKVAPIAERKMEETLEQRGL